MKELNRKYGIVLSVLMAVVAIGFSASASQAGSLCVDKGTLCADSVQVIGNEAMVLRPRMKFGNDSLYILNVGYADLYVCEAMGFTDVLGKDELIVSVSLNYNRPKNAIRVYGASGSFEARFEKNAIGSEGRHVLEQVHCGR
jgi:hypothetical protein